MYTQVTKQEAAADALPERKAVGLPSKAYRWTAIQAAVCILILLAALLLKTFFPAVYQDLREEYTRSMERSVLYEPDSSNREAEASSRNT